MDCIAVNQSSSLKWSFYQDVVRYASRGLDGIGVCRQKLSDVGRDEAADFLYEMKMSVSSLSWAGGFTGCNAMSLRDAIDDAIDGIETAAMLKANCLVIHSGHRNGHTYKHSRRLFDDAMFELLPIAEELGVTLALEPMDCVNSPRWSLFCGLQETISTVRSFDVPQLQIVLDLFHVGGDRSAAQCLQEYLDLVCLVQFSDRKSADDFSSIRTVPGGGNIPLLSWVKLLAHAGYNGPIEVEVFGSETSRVGYDYTLVQSSAFLHDARTTRLSIQSQPANRVR
ncbi:MAG: sugar phosphate isomerase/epimerase family protein [Pirellulaceae bacterium]